MSIRYRSSVANFFRMVGNAAAAAAAIDGGRQPQNRDLRALGIDPEQFRKIKRYY